MTHPPALRVATLLLACDGLAALHLAGLVGDGGALAAALVVAATWWSEPLRDRVNAVPGLVRGLVLIAAVASAIDLGYFADSTLDGLARLLLFLLIYRLVMRGPNFIDELRGFDAHRRNAGERIEHIDVAVVEDRRLARRCLDGADA